MNLAKLRLILEAQTSRFNKDMRKAQGELKRTSKTMDGVTKSTFSLRDAAKVMIAVMAVRKFAEISKAIFDIGASVEETQSKFSTVFGANASEVQGFLDEFAAMAGLSNREAQALVATTGAMVQGMGFAQDASAELSQQVVRLAADLSSFNDLPTEEVLNAVQSAIAGEREQLKRLGIVILETDVQNRARLNTGKETVKQLTQQEKVTATLQLITERAGFAMDDLGRTQDSAANRAKLLGAEFRDLRDVAATSLQPAFLALLGTVGDNITIFDTLKGAIKSVSEFAAFVVLNIQSIGPALAVASAQIDVFAARMAESQTGGILGLGEGAGLLDPLGLDLFTKAAEAGGRDVPKSLEAAEQALADMLLAADIVNREGLENFTDALAKIREPAAAAVEEINSIEDALTALGAATLTLPDVLPVIPLQLLDAPGEKIEPLDVEIRATVREFSNLDRATADFARDFASRMASAATGAENAFEGMFKSILQMLAEIAIQMAILGILESVAPDSRYTKAFAASLGVTSDSATTSAKSVVATDAKGLRGSKATVVNQTVNFSVNTIDARGVSQVLREQKGTLTEMMAEAAVGSPSFRRALGGARG